MSSTKKFNPLALNAVQQTIKFVLDNIEKDDDGDYILDFIGNKTHMLILDKDEVNEFKKLVKSDFISIYLTNI